mmetsp:Transcript_126492/g.247988  ORF Transcript_126492/g.247988 Transcript_126492/m.247988 type:complete len:332 (+) Transcript_126492:3-998(+)
MTPGAKKPVMKKGFLNSSRAKGSLYGEGGSGEGVLPENAGDPLGYIPKKLRNTCKIVDCNAPEYQETERKRREVEQHNALNAEFKHELTKDMEKWVKLAQPDKWEEDLPEGAEPASEVQKYDIDYSRFDKLDELDEPAPVEQRDWYIDGSGVRRSIERPRPQAETSAAAGEGIGVAAPPAVKKGFFNDAKSPLYPKGSEQAKAPLSDEQLLKELMVEHERATASTPSTSAVAAEAERKSSVKVKVPEYKAPEFELNETLESLQLAVSVPVLESMQGVELDVTERRATLGFPANSGLWPLEVELPVSVVPTQVKAKYSKKTRHINVTLPRAA